MSIPAVNKLNREKIQQLLAAVGSAPAEESAQTEHTNYNWYQPHCFNNNQLGRLDDFAKKLAKAVANRFGDLYQRNYEVTASSTTLHFAETVFNEILQKKDCLISFDTDKPETCGFIGIPTQTAILWVKQLLGETESQEEGKEGLSPLEESLLLDIGSAIIKALSSCHDSFLDVRAARMVAKDWLPPETAGTEEMCKIVLEVKRSEGEKSGESGNACLLMPCSQLGLVVGVSRRPEMQYSAQAVSKAILNHLKQMPVTVTVRLASTMLTFEETVGIGPDDILLLDRAANEPIELIVEGQTLFRGRPAKSMGQYAVVITELPDDVVQQTNPVGDAQIV